MTVQNSIPVYTNSGGVPRRGLGTRLAADVATAGFQWDSEASATEFWGGGIQGQLGSLTHSLARNVAARGPVASPTMFLRQYDAGADGTVHVPSDAPAAVERRRCICQYEDNLGQWSVRQTDQQGPGNVALSFSTMSRRSSRRCLSARREPLNTMLDEPWALLKAYAREQAEVARPAYENRNATYGAKSGRRGREPNPPDDEPPPETQISLTDPDNRLAQRSDAHEIRQTYIAHAVICAKGSRL